MRELFLNESSSLGEVSIENEEYDNIITDEVDEYQV
jgi:hypothetical protein